MKLDVVIFPKNLIESFQLSPSLSQHMGIYSLFGDKYTSVENDFTEICEDMAETLHIFINTIINHSKD